MQSPPFPRYLLPPRPKYSPQHHVPKHPQLYKTIGKIVVLYILIFIVSDSELEDRRYCTA